MHVRSLGWRTDLIFPRFDGIILDRGDYLVIHTPPNPDFYWGNFLLFAHPPGPDSLPEWKRLFQQEIAALQPARHLAFGWDGDTAEAGALEPFLAAGFILEENAVLTAAELVPPPRWNDEVSIRPLSTDAEWAQALENQIDCHGGEFVLAEYRPFKARQMERYRRLAGTGRGAWFGAFAGDRLVADLGVFVDGGLARYQAVETHPDFRRRGICGTLVYEAARYARAELGAQTLVITADEHYHAGAIYESLGFRRTQRQLGVSLRPPA
jgi:ribosomal protein S18 acetylase RimI-like enzyme